MRSRLCAGYDGKFNLLKRKLWVSVYVFSTNSTGDHFHGGQNLIDVIVGNDKNMNGTVSLIPWLYFMVRNIHQ